MTTSVNSWPPVNLDIIDSKYKCPQCMNLLVSVHQADDCDCRFCYECLSLIM